MSERININDNAMKEENNDKSKRSNSFSQTNIKDTTINHSRAGLNTLMETTWFADVEKRSWNFSTPGHGHDETWWSQFLLAVRSVGYEDVLSIEHEDCSLGRLEAMKLTMEFLERILINDKIDYEWSEQKRKELHELWLKGLPESEISKISN